MKYLIPALFLSLTAVGSAGATAPSALSPVYAHAGQYTASLDRDSQRWQLTPIVGEVQEIRSSELCPSTARPLPGLWLVGRDAEGRPELVAPSATLLPQGHSGRVALRACDDPALQSAQVDAYGVPGKVLEWLVREAGAVMVDD
jgi:hypothetical protein